MSRQTPTRGEPSEVLEDRGQVLEPMSEIGSLTGGVLQQHLRARRVDAPASSCDSPSAISRKPVLLSAGRVGAGMHDEAVEPERFGPIQFLAERRNRLRAQRRRGRRRD